MGRLARIVVCAAGLLLHPEAVLAQQGSLQVFTGVQTLRGDPSQFAGQNAFEPDLGISWLQPGSRFGIFQIELRGVRRGDTLHTGRMYGALREAKFRGARWTIEAGDTYFSPPLTGYGFTNLFTPAVTFNGAMVQSRTDRTTLAIAAGQTTAWRNIFGSDPEGLGQSIAIGHLTHRLGSRVEVSGRGSRIRTSSLGEFTYTIDASDQIGTGARVWLTPSLQLIADSSLVSYRRTGTSSWERDGSYLGGINWLHRRGWVQVNASRFSPGDFPSLNNPLSDRAQLFAAGEYDLLSHARVSAGWERFRTNLDPDASASSAQPTPQTAGDRGFGGVRVQLTSRSSVAARAERGNRESHPVGPGLPSESDTGMWSAEWQAAMGRINTFVRYSGRDNVEHVNQSGSYDQRDAAAQLFTNLPGGSQAFGIAVLTRTTSLDGGGNSYWQAGGGTQLRVGHRDLWFRAEGNAARNMDLLTGTYVPRESFVLGVNGQLSRRTTVSFNVNMDRSAPLVHSGPPWMTRSMIRVTHTLPTGSAFLPTTTAAGAAESGRGTGTISGLVFADWNGDGTQDPGENTLEGIPLRLGNGHATSGRDGQFAFMNVPAGARSVDLDTTALPVDFDAPSLSQVQVELSRGDSKRVTFGLIPLGAIHGRVVQDLNGNGRADANEEGIDGAVIVLDGGMRSEQARHGRYRFDAVRSGPHRVTLLLESLPDGAVISGEPEVTATLARNALNADVTFVVSVDKRPEIRKVFPPRGGRGNNVTVAAPRSASTRAPMPRATVPAATTTAASLPGHGHGETPGTKFAIQIAALNDPVHARDAVQQLRAIGMPAYLMNPAADDPDGPYRVRVGPYDSRDEAQKIAASLEQQRHQKLWVTKER